MPSWKEIAQAKAREQLQMFQVISAPVPIEFIAEGNGAVIHMAPLDDELSGMLFRQEGVAVIGVNSLHHPNRRRFTIAHELGHLILHPDIITSEVHVDKNYPVLWRDKWSSTGLDEREVQANAFAAELLMPKEMLDQIVTESIDIDEDEQFVRNLAKQFRVSAAAMRNRLSSLYSSSF